jgi:hypothetical protein
MDKTENIDKRGQPPLGLSLFCFALMGPAVGINAAFVALTIPKLAAYGTNGLLVAGAVGVVLGIFPARWLARRIHEGLADDK